MPLVDGSKLDYLHDGRLHEVNIIALEKSRRDIQIRLTCSTTAGLPEWEGKPLLLVAKDVFYSNIILLGHMAGFDSIDSCEMRISSETEEKLRKFASDGLVIPAVPLSVSFHSGSSVELVCWQLDVEVLI